LFRTIRNLFFALFHKIGAGLEENVFGRFSLFIYNPEVLYVSNNHFTWYDTQVC